MGTTATQPEQSASIEAIEASIFVIKFDSVCFDLEDKLSELSKLHQELKPVSVLSSADRQTDLNAKFAAPRSSARHHMPPHSVW